MSTKITPKSVGRPPARVFACSGVRLVGCTPVRVFINADFRRVKGKIVDVNANFSRVKGKLSTKIGPQKRRLSACSPVRVFINADFCRVKGEINADFSRVKGKLST